MKTTFKNGSKEITVSITGQQDWTAEGQARTYFDLSFDEKRAPISKLYEVKAGTTRDKTIELDGRFFGYLLICESHSKKDAATAAVQDLVSQIVAE